MRLLIASAALAAALVLPSAAQASCAAPMPREDRIAQADAAFVGTVVRREGSVYVFRVERVVKGLIAGEAELRVRDEAPNSSVGLSLQPGDRVGLLLRTDTSDADDGGAAYIANDCQRIGPDDLIAAAPAAPTCKAGARPAVRAPSRRYAVRPRVLACGRTPAGVPFQIAGSRRKGSARPCIKVIRLPRGPATDCGDGRIRGDDNADLDGRAGRLLTGTTSPFAGGIAVFYASRDGEETVRQAALVTVDGSRVLRRLRLPGAFATWVADFPSGALATALELHTFNGASVGRIPLQDR